MDIATSVQSGALVLTPGEKQAFDAFAVSLNSTDALFIAYYQWSGNAGASDSQPGQHDQFTDGGPDDAGGDKLMATAIVTPTSTTPNWLTLVQLFSNVALTGLTAGGVLPPGTSCWQPELRMRSCRCCAASRAVRPRRRVRWQHSVRWLAFLQATSKQTGLSAQQSSNIQALETAVSDAIVAFMSRREWCTGSGDAGGTGADNLARRAKESEGMMITWEQKDKAAIEATEMTPESLGAAANLEQFENEDYTGPSYNIASLARGGGYGENLAIHVKSVDHI